jgi:hypothetical protein
MTLDMPLFTASLNDEIYRQRVREHLAGGQRSHVRASTGYQLMTPWFEAGWSDQQLAWADFAL